MTKPSHESPVVWDHEFDVVVAGAGAAGLQAAIEASLAGATTVVLEKLPHIWGSSTALAVGSVSFSGTQMQRDCGVQDSYDLMVRDLMETGKYKSDRAIVETYVANQLDTHRQLSALGIQWSPVVTAMAGMTVARSHLTDTLILVRTLELEAKRRGAKIMFQSPVVALLTDADGAITGVTIRLLTGKEQNIRARKGVVLATGGFARDPERLRTVEPRFDKVLPTSSEGHTGDHLRMAEPLGALTRDIQYVQPSFELHASGGTSEAILLLYYQGGIIVNANGDRFVDESISYKDISGICLGEPGMMGHQIFDATVYDKAVAEQAVAKQSSPTTLDDAKIRLLVKGDTIAELARNSGIPPDRLERTIARYNRFVDEGNDADFGRKSLAGHYGTLQRIEKAPFYAFATIGHLLATYAGLAVDTHMRVLAQAGPIPGLYAAGEAMGGFHGTSYHSGTGLGKALVFGRIAGKSAAMRPG